MTTDPNDAGAEHQRPLFSVVKGDPSEEELAALTLAVMLQRGNTEPKASANPITEVGRLISRRQRLGAGLRPGPGSWRRARPR